MAGTGRAHMRDRDDILLKVENLEVVFKLGRKRTLKAVSGVSFDVAERETLGIVGDSGSGKSTVARAIVRLEHINSGRLLYRGQDLALLRGEELRRIRPNIQMIFQDPVSSLNPRRRVRDVIAEGLKVWGDDVHGSAMLRDDAVGGTMPRDDVLGSARPGEGADPSSRIALWTADNVDELMRAVGIDPSMGDRRPHQFSGGQCQRIGIARALALRPEVLICDEPVSALDVSVQAQILNLLQDTQQAYQLTMLFISHDLAVVKNVSDRIAVMYLGKVCEIGAAEEIYQRPAHPYTRSLLASASEPPASVDPSESSIKGEPPSPVSPPSGCRFHPRCPRASDLCRSQAPTIQEVSLISGGGFGGGNTGGSGSASRGDAGSEGAGGGGGDSSRHDGSGDDSIIRRDHFVACHHPVLTASPVGL